MRLYRHLADYLQDQPCDLNATKPLQLRGSDRPFLVLDDGDELTKNDPFLIKRQSHVYEIGFPFVKIEEWEKHQDSEEISKSINLITKSGLEINFDLADEVLDKTQISTDEDKLKQLEQQLGKKCDRHTSEAIGLFIGLFDHLLGKHKNQKSASCPLLKIPDLLQELSQQDARLPLILALNRRYELRHKLELIAPKLRSHLTRTAEMVPIAKIQEMDAYCLRDYVRRPGSNAAEKAGSRQQLMGIQRYQSFDTAENRFLKGFCNLLHLDSREYRDRHPEAKSLERAIDRFRQEPSVQSISRTGLFAVKPNYVLQQNPIYRSFYQAYLDYLKRRTEKEKMWGLRQALLVDVVTIMLVTALLNLNGSYVSPLSSVDILSTPNYGKYLDDNEKHQELTKLSISVQSVLQSSSFKFTVIQPCDPKSGDLQLKIEKQTFSSQKGNLLLPIWLFWYRPNLQLLQAMQTNQQGRIVCFYLYDRPDENPQSPDQSSKIFIKQLPDPVDDQLETGVEILSALICKWFGG
jgi:hypothetical protein